MVGDYGQVSGSRTENDFDLHGIVGISLVDCTEADIRTVRRQLGPIQGPLEREPDIIVRFVDKATESRLRYVGLTEGGYSDDGFFVLKGSGRSRAKARIPFAEIGERPTIVCERGMPAVPHLLAIINLTALSKGVLPLHASAFILDSTGVLVTGWAKGGKTESLLGAMSKGAKYVGDEWIFLTPDAQMFGLPEPIRLWSWHLHQARELLGARSTREQVRLATWHRAAGLATAAARARVPGAGLLRKGAPVIARQAYLQVPPEDLFAPESVVLQGRIDTVVLVGIHESADTVVQSVAGAEVAGRMAASLTAERAAFMDHYVQFRYAFPGKASGLVERGPALESELLKRLFEGRPAAKVEHPYPCDIAELATAVMSAATENPYR